MSQNIQTIILNTLLEKWKENPNIFDALPEFNFVPPLGAKIKEKGCTCGMGTEIGTARSAFNSVVSNLNEEQVGRMKFLFEKEQLCFGIQTNDTFDVKCY